MHCSGSPHNALHSSSIFVCAVRQFGPRGNFGAIFWARGTKTPIVKWLPFANLYTYSPGKIFDDGLSERNEGKITYSVNNHRHLQFLTRLLFASGIQLCLHRRLRHGLQAAMEIQQDQRELQEPKPASTTIALQECCLHPCYPPRRPTAQNGTLAKCAVPLLLSSLRTTMDPTIAALSDSNLAKLMCQGGAN